MFLPEKKGQQTINTTKTFLVVNLGGKTTPSNFPLETWAKNSQEELSSLESKIIRLKKMAVMTSEGVETQRGCCLSNAQLGERI